MTEEEFQEILSQAMLRTSARQARVVLTLQREAEWVVLLEDRGEELAIRVPWSPDSTREDLQARIIAELQKLF